MLPAALLPLAGAPGRAGVLSDFDGTLALIVDDPGAAAPLPGVVDVLGRLARRFAVVAVVSGRPVAYLLQRVAIEGVQLSGLYGLERARAGQVVADVLADAWRPVVGATAVRAVDAFPGAVEEKGLSLTLHFRTTPGLEPEVRAWASEEAARSGLVVRSAKASLELHPPVALDKGSVVDELAVGLEAVCYLADDVGDLPAYAALDRLAAAGIATAKVAVRTSESPPEILLRADVVVDGPEGALALLQALDAAARA